MTPIWQGYGSLPADYGSAYGAPKEKRGGGVKGIGPEKLWAMDPSKRPINAIGFFTGTLAGGEDEVIVIAAGARTSFKNRIVEDRCTVRGGVEVLRAAGVAPYTSIDTSGLKSGIFQTNKQDAALIRAAGGRGDKESDVKDAANRIRQVVIKHHLARAAWGARGLYVLGNLKGFAVKRGILGTVVGIIAPPVGALMAAHGAISGSVTKGISASLKKDLDEGLAAGKQALADRRSAPKTSETLPALPPPPTPSVPLWGWGLGALLIIGGIGIAMSSSNRGGSRG